MSVQLQTAINAADAAFDRIVNGLKDADARGASRDEKALLVSWSYVWAAAALERYMKEAIEAALLEINSQRVPAVQLRKSLFALVLAPSFDAIKTAKKARDWRIRASLFNSLDGTGEASFNLSVKPLDGRTITGDHFECVWDVFGFPLPIVPTPRHSFALRDLADGRNKVAHGEEDPIDFGRTKLIPDVVNVLDLVNDAMLHLWINADSYLRLAGYFA